MKYNFNSLCSNVIPVGKYKVMVTDAKFKASASGESLKDIIITYTIVDGPLAKKTFTDTIWGKSFSFRLKPFLSACKIDLNREFNTLDELYNYGLKEVKNKIVLVDLTVNTYNGNEYNNITNWYPLPDSSVSSTEVLKEFGTNPNLKPDMIKESKQEEKEPSVAFDLNDENDTAQSPIGDTFSDEDLLF